MGTWNSSLFQASVAQLNQFLLLTIILYIKPQHDGQVKVHGNTAGICFYLTQSQRFRLTEDYDLSRDYNYKLLSYGGTQ